MSSEPLEISSNSSGDLGELAIDEVVLTAETARGLTGSTIRNIKVNVALANEAWNTAGDAVRATAEALWRIKDDLRSKGQRNWKALIRSDSFVFSESIATDLVSAYEWLMDAPVPDACLMNVSARTLKKVSNLQPALQDRATAAIIANRGKGFSEADLTAIVSPSGSKKKKGKVSLIAMGELPSDATEEVKVKHAIKLIDKLSAQNESLQKARMKLEANKIEMMGEIAKLKGQIEAMKDSNAPALSI